MSISFEKIKALNQRLAKFISEVDIAIEQKVTQDNLFSIPQAFVFNESGNIQSARQEMDEFFVNIRKMRTEVKENGLSLSDLPSPHKELWESYATNQHDISAFNTLERKYRAMIKEFGILPVHQIPLNNRQSDFVEESRIYSAEELDKANAMAVEPKNAFSISLSSSKFILRDLKEEIKNTPVKRSSDPESHDCPVNKRPKSDESSSSSSSSYSSHKELFDAIEKGDVLRVREYVRDDISFADKIASKETGDTFLMQALRSKFVNSDLISALFPIAQTSNFNPQTLYRILTSENKVSLSKDNALIIAASKGKLPLLLKGIAQSLQNASLSTKKITSFETKTRDAIKKTREYLEKNLDPDSRMRVSLKNEPVNFTSSDNSNNFESEENSRKMVKK